MYYSINYEYQIQAGDYHFINQVKTLSKGIQISLNVFNQLMVCILTYKVTDCCSNHCSNCARQKSSSCKKLFNNTIVELVAEVVRYMGDYFSLEGAQHSVSYSM